GPNVPLVLYRQAPPPADILDDAYTKESHHDFSDTYPPCPNLPFEIPRPAGLTLHVSLGKLVSEGRTGMIFECECTIPHGNEVGYKIPPIVVKIARQFHTKDISGEATVYECMKSIQGSVVPRCYGFFQARYVYFLLCSNTSISAQCLFSFWNNLGIYPNSESPFQMVQSMCQRYFFTLILTINVRSDMEDACSDLAQLRILHCDLRWANMLSVLPGGPPSLASPFTGKTYGWRLVDFDRAERTTQALPATQRYYNSYLKRVLKSIPWGDPIEPWD
ncbi:hypothetical protein EV368DRAFT_45782, partial [Lentinula lateritia]